MLNETVNARASVANARRPGSSTARGSHVASHLHVAESASTSSPRGPERTSDMGASAFPAILPYTLYALPPAPSPPHLPRPPRSCLKTAPLPQQVGTLPSIPMARLTTGTPRPGPRSTRSRPSSTPRLRILRARTRSTKTAAAAAAGTAAVGMAAVVATAAAVVTAAAAATATGTAVARTRTTPTPTPLACSSASRGTPTTRTYRTRAPTHRRTRRLPHTGQRMTSRCTAARRPPS